MSDKLLSVEDVAERLGVTQDTIRHWVRTKQLVAIRLGNKYKIRESDLEQFLEERRTKKDDEK